MNPPRAPFLSWPGCGILGEALVLGTAQTLWWLAVYVSADWLTGLRAERVRIHLDAELQIPFIPAMILVYRSIDLMFPLAPFVLRTRPEIRALTATLVVVTGIAGVGFLLLPAEAAYPPQAPGDWAQLYTWNQRIVLTYNMAPSLHVALSIVTLSAYARRRGRVGKTLLTAWAAAIAVSTLLTHHHHLLDVFTGLLLGWGGYALVYRRWLDRAAAARIAPPNLSSDPTRPA